MPVWNCFLIARVYKCSQFWKTCTLQKRGRCWWIPTATSSATCLEWAGMNPRKISIFLCGLRHLITVDGDIKTNLDHCFHNFPPRGVLVSCIVLQLLLQRTWYTCSMPQAEILELRRTVIELVLGTDMKQHFSVIGKVSLMPLGILHECMPCVVPFYYIACNNYLKTLFARRMQKIQQVPIKHAIPCVLPPPSQFNAMHGGGGDVVADVLTRASDYLESLHPAAAPTSMGEGTGEGSSVGLPMLQLYPTFLLITCPRMRRNASSDCRSAWLPPLDISPEH